MGVQKRFDVAPQFTAAALRERLELRRNRVALGQPATDPNQIEALTLETQYFVDCVLNDESPFNDGSAGLRVVQMLEAIDESISQKGKMVYCSSTADHRAATA